MSARSISSRQPKKGERMPFEVPPLPYDYDALEGTEWADRPVEQILGDALDVLPEDKRTPVRNNAGGHANHSLFWELMSPGGGGEPSGSLAKAIEDTFNSLDALKEQ